MAGEDKDAGATPGASSIPDLNDPNLRLDRTSAMAAMSARRRETVMADLSEQEKAAVEAARAAEAADPTPAAAAPAGADEDTDAADAVAAAARAELERKAAAEDAAEPPRAPAPKDDVVLDAAKQTAVQDEYVDLTDDDLKHVRIKKVVNGEETWVTGEELRREAQKTAAADLYLATAKEMLAEVKAMKPASPAAAPADDRKGEVTPANADLVNEAVDALFAGDEAKTKEALGKLVSSGSGKQADADHIAREVEQKIVIRSALRQFSKDHKDIVADPHLRKIADGFLYAELGQRGVQDLSQLSADAIPEVIDLAGTRTKDWLRERAGLPKASGTGGTAKTLSERLQRKKTIDELPSAGVRAVTQATPARSTTDVINAMRQARGQPVSS